MYQGTNIRRVCLHTSTSEHTHINYVRIHIYACVCVCVRSCLPPRRMIAGSLAANLAPKTCALLLRIMVVYPSRGHSAVSD
jgi:hypothetical protein